MSTLSATEQLLFDTAKKALPRFLFESEGNAQEILAGFAKAIAPAWDQCGIYINGTKIQDTDSTQLDSHAVDRGTRRRNGESDESLRLRLRTFDQRVTPNAIKSVINDVLATNAAVMPTGYPGFVELRPNKIFLNRAAYLNRGYRVSRAPRDHTIIIILPYGTSATVASAVAEAVRLARAGGVLAYVEVRGVP